MENSLKNIAKDIRSYLKRNGYNRNVKVTLKKEVFVIDNLPEMVYAHEIAMFATGYDFIYMGRSMCGLIKKTYALICPEFGRKFSFHASNEMDAINKAKNWTNYHSISWQNGYKVEETTEEFDLHNEYVTK